MMFYTVKITRGAAWYFAVTTAIFIAFLAGIIGYELGEIGSLRGSAIAAIVIIVLLYPVVLAFGYECILGWKYYYGGFFQALAENTKHAHITELGVVDEEEEDAFHVPQDWMGDRVKRYDVYGYRFEHNTVDPLRNIPTMSNEVKNKRNTLSLDVIKLYFRNSRNMSNFLVCIPTRLDAWFISHQS